MNKRKILNSAILFFNLIECICVHIRTEQFSEKIQKKN